MIWFVKQFFVSVDILNMGMTKQLTTVLSFALTTLLSISTLAAAMYTTYQAKIIKPDGMPLESTNVNFRFTILDPLGACILYTENFNTINMAGSGGLVYFSLGSGIKTFPTSGTVNFSDVFNNHSTSLSCEVGGPPSYSPAANDLRKIVMQFHDGSGWQTLPAMSINYVPYAMYAKNAASATTAVNSNQLNGKTDLDFVQVTSIPTCSASQALQFNGASFSCVAVGSSGGGGTIVSVSGSAPIAISGSASAPVISISVASMSSDGYLTAADYATFSNKLNATSAAVISALGYTPADANVVGSSFSTVTTNVSNLSSSMTTLNSTVSSLSSSVGAIVSSQWNTSGTTINYMNGNVGIGITDPGLVLHVAGVNGFPATSGTAQTGSFRIGNTVSQRVLDFGIDGATSTAWMQSTTKNSLSNANNLAINPNGGNVGIGTTNPQSALDVVGNLHTTGNTYVGKGSAATDVVSRIYAGNEAVSLKLHTSSGAGGVFIGSETNHFLSLRTNNTDRLRVDNTGNVGVGITNPSALLHLNAGTSSVASFKFTSGTLLTSPQSGTMEYDGFNFYITDSTNTRRTIATGSSQGTIDNASNINSSGNITMTPVGSVIVSSTTASTNSSTGALIVKGGLGVAGNINTAVNLNVSGSSTIDGSLKLSSMTSGSVIFAGANGTITQDNSSFYWDGANKRLGIGTTLPLFKIEVSGTTTSDKKIGINGTQVVYLPDQSGSGFRGSLFVGNGGASMTHSVGSEGQYNTGVGIGALYSNTSGNENTATGNEALYFNTTGQDNTATGNYALHSNTTGSYNTANGYMALYSSITGYDNVANGYYSLYSNTSGSRNTAAGNYALYSNTSGDENTATGNSALESNQAGIRNTATGQYALSRNKTKSESTAVGYGSMRYADDVSATVTSSYNTAIGAYSLQGSITAANNTGIRNTALGHSALKNMTSGSSNTALGYNAGSAITTGSNNVILGSNDGSSIATSSNNILIADGEGNERIRINSSGNVGIGTTTPRAPLDVSGNVTVGDLAANNALVTIYTRDSGSVSHGLALIDRAAGYGSWQNPSGLDGVSADSSGTVTGWGTLYFNYYSSGNIDFNNGGGYSKFKGGVAVGTGAAPTAKLQIGAGTSSTAPLKFTSGPLLTTPQAGSVEYDGSNYYFTDATSTRRSISSIAASATAVAGSSGQVQYNNAGSLGANSSFRWNTTENSLNVGPANSFTGSGLAVANQFVLDLAAKDYKFVEWSGNMAIASCLNASCGSYSMLASFDPVNGSFGIGTTPAAKLHVNGSAGAATVLLNNNALGSAVTNGVLMSADTTGFEINNQHSSAITFKTASAERLRITAAGNVGIGTSAPSYPLQVHASGTSSLMISTGADDSRLYFTDTNRSIRGVAGGGLAVETGASEKLRIDSSGNVGIGTTTPSQKLEVSGGIKISGVGQIGPSGTYGYGMFQAGTSTFAGQMYGIASGVQFTDSAGANTITIKDGGNVGIGTTTPATKLDVVGDIQYTGTITDVSDRRLKTNITPLDSALSTVRKIKTYSYVMKDDPKARTEYGVMAQDMLGIIPNLVKNIDVRGEYYGVNYVGLIPWSIRAIQEVDRETQNLRRENTEIKRELASLKEKNEVLEQKLEKILQALEQQKHYGEKK